MRNICIVSFLRNYKFYLILCTYIVEKMYLYYFSNQSFYYQIVLRK